MKTRWCDPPSGWKYGFPREVPDEVTRGEKDMDDWLVECGYPMELIESFGQHFYLRFWYQIDDPD